MVRMIRALRPLALVAAVGLVGTTTSLAGAAASGCDDPSNLCVDSSSGAKWEADKQTGPKDKKKRSEKNGGTISLTIDGGRGSIFVNGRYAGTAPVSGISVPGGRNDVQVRDGSTVLSSGVLTVPKGASLDITVRHP